MKLNIFAVNVLVSKLPPATLSAPPSMSELGDGARFTSAAGRISMLSAPASESDEESSESEFRRASLESGHGRIGNARKSRKSEQASDPPNRILAGWLDPATRHPQTGDCRLVASSGLFHAQKKHGVLIFL